MAKKVNDCKWSDSAHSDWSFSIVLCVCMICLTFIIHDLCVHGVKYTSL